MAESTPTTAIAATPASEQLVEKARVTDTTTEPTSELALDAPAAADPPSLAEVPEPEFEKRKEEQEEKTTATNPNKSDENNTPVVIEAPAGDVKFSSNGPVWPQLSETHPLAKFQSRLRELLETAGYADIWGIKLSAEHPIPFHTTLILQKFLRANFNDIDKAYNQLLKTLKWRKAYNPQATIEETFSQSKFGGLGYITKVKTKEGKEKIVTWNIYGSCKDPKKTFSNLDSFLRWRIALMELGIRALDLPSATEPIPNYNASNPGAALDPYQMIQLHDYQNVSFFRMDSTIKTASKKTIEVMADYYPELLSLKIFVNVPAVMGYIFTAMKAFLSKETVRKFRVISSGKSVVNELGEEVPPAYGGKGQDLKAVGQSPALVADADSSGSSTPDRKKSKADLRAEARRGKEEKKKAEKEEKSLPETPAVVNPVSEPTVTAAPQITEHILTTIPEAKEGGGPEAEKSEAAQAVPQNDTETDTAINGETHAVEALAAAAAEDATAHTEPPTAITEEKKDEEKKDEEEMAVEEVKIEEKVVETNSAEQLAVLAQATD